MSSLHRISILGAFSLFLAACDEVPETIEEPPLRLVRTITLSTTDRDTWQELPGVVEAARQAELSFRVSGNLENLVAKEGDLVNKDQLLAQLDDVEYSIQLNSRKAEYDKANADFKRGQSLVGSGTISRSDYENLKTQRDTSSAALAAARQNVEYTSLKAPFGGRIAKRHVENYEEIRAQQAIYMLQDLTALTVRVDVPESIMIRAQKDRNPEVYAVFAQFPERRFPLTLKEVSSQADAQTNTFGVSFSMSAVDNLNILPGMSVTVHARPDPERNGAKATLSIPAHAVLEDSEGRFVYVVKPNGDNRGRIERRNVSVGELSNSGLDITSGLQVGDQVVTAGMSKMSIGLEVKLTAE